MRSVIIPGNDSKLCISPDGRIEQICGEQRTVIYNGPLATLYCELIEYEADLLTLQRKRNRRRCSQCGAMTMEDPCWHCGDYPKSPEDERITQAIIKCGDARYFVIRQAMK